MKLTPTILIQICALIFSTAAVAKVKPNKGAFQSYANYRAKKEFKKMRAEALKCIELEGVSKEVLNEFFRSPPPTPYWSKLRKLKKNHARYSSAASQLSSNDKVRHCFAGYMIARDLDYRTALFAAYYKEAQDVSDCNKKTHFEIADKIATIKGASLSVSGHSIDLCRELN
jgi:hypothetical protein